MKNTKEQLELMTNVLIINCRASESKEVIGNNIMEFTDKVVKLFALPQINNRREQLIAYQLWCYQHPEYDQVCQSSKVDIYLKAINC